MIKTNNNTNKNDNTLNDQTGTITLTKISMPMVVRRTLIMILMMKAIKEK